MFSPVEFHSTQLLPCFMCFVSELESDDELISKRIARILTTDVPKYFAIIMRLRQDSSVISDEGGCIRSTIEPRVQLDIPQNAFIRKLQIALQVMKCKYYSERTSPQNVINPKDVCVTNIC